MPNIATVAVHIRTRAVDRLFDYQIPDHLTVVPGVRVEVPFGAGNRMTDAIVTEVRQAEQVEGLKQIASVQDMEPLCDPDLLPLALWIRNRYFCTFYDALRLLFPPGTGIKYEEVVRLAVPLEHALEKTSRSAVQQAVVTFLGENNGVAAMEELRDAVGQTVRNGVRGLSAKQVVVIEKTKSYGVRHKQVRMASLCLDGESVQLFLEEQAGKAPAQARILETLLVEGSLSVPELLDSAEAGRGSLEVLERRGFVTVTKQMVERNTLWEEDVELQPPLTPNEEQQQVIDRLCAALTDGGEYLLWGVTGSGKTEVYLHVIAEALRTGKGAMLLVPEIALTPQTIRRFVSRFGERVAVLHSRLSLGERFDQWERIRRGEADVVVGVRSAVFAPVKNLGVIVVDEQQEDSYRSESSPRYDAREVAAMRAKRSGALLVQASATPRVRDVYTAPNRLVLKQRANRAALPSVEIVDMCQELKEGNSSLFSGALRRAMEESLRRGEQTVLFVSRRGHSSFVSCRSCGHVFSCPNCSIALKYHSYSNRLLCHYCGYMEPAPKVCPVCGSRFVKYFGLGTQRVEEELQHLFPGARLLRMDADTTTRKSSHQRILDRFAAGEADILLGTQMVTKGLDFPHVSLVGVLAADLMLNDFDYLANERAFSRLTQVCGRAGRGETAGRAVIQTYQPGHSVLQYAKAQDYGQFYKNEINLRKSLFYPPFCDIITLLVTGRDAEAVKEHVFTLYRTLEDGKPPALAQMLYPVPCGVSKINREYRWQLTLKATGDLSPLLWELLEQSRKKKDTMLSIL